MHCVNTHSAAWQRLVHPLHNQPLLRLQLAVVELTPYNWDNARQLGATNRQYRDLAARQGAAVIECGQVRVHRVCVGWCCGQLAALRAAAASATGATYC